MAPDLPDLSCPGCGTAVLDIDVKCPECGVPLASTGAQRLVGTVVLDQYEIVDVLGQGGMSVVYRARHRLTDQAVALKILPPELARHTQVKSRFLDEARALAQMDHPNIVHLYNFGEDKSCFVLAMQFIEGATWERTILEDDGLEWRRSTEIAIDVLKALEYAHARGVVHRDMKPSNVLIKDADGSVTVMDFGIAKMTTSSRLTATGQTMGTVRYMSPEQVRGHEVDLRTDIYSLSCTLYESLLGDTPFDGDTHFEIMTKHLSEPPRGLIEQGVDCSAALEAAVLKGLAKAPDDRYATAAEFREVLEACLAGNARAPDRVRDEPSRPADVLRVVRAVPRVVEIGTTEPVDGAVTGGRMPKAGRPLLWLALAGVALAGVAGAFYLNQRTLKPAEPQPRPTERLPDDWPEPMVFPRLSVAARQIFEVDRIQVLSEGARDLNEIRDSLAAGRDEFVALLRELEVSGEVIDRPLNVVVVHESRWFCRKELHRGSRMPDDCGQLQFHYRPFDRTVYIRDNDALVANLKQVQALYICVHSPDLVDCGAGYDKYRERLSAPK